MGIRFACHVCQKPLNIKADLAGKRGVCPQCCVRFRIPSSDTAFSIPIDEGNRETVDEMEFDDDGESVVSPPHSSEPAGGSVAANVALRDAVTKPSMGEKARPSLLDDPSATWYVRPPSGGQYGPATGEMLRSWISEARVTPTSLVWRDGWAQWRSASDALVEFGGSKPLDSLAPVTAATLNPAPAQTPVAPAALAGDATIGAKKSKLTQRRFVIVGTLAAVSMTLVGLLIFLLQR